LICHAVRFCPRYKQQKVSLLKLLFVSGTSKISRADVLNAHNTPHAHMHAHMYACTHVHMHAHTHGCTHTRTNSRAHARMRTRTHAPTRAPTHTSTHSSKRKRIQTHTRTHARTHTHAKHINSPGVVGVRLIIVVTNPHVEPLQPVKSSQRRWAWCCT